MKGWKNLKKDLSKVQVVGVDTNFFIYYFQKHKRFGPVIKDVLSLLSEHQTTLTTSILTMTELLSFKAPKLLLARLEKELMLLSNLQLIDVNSEIAKEAATIRRKFRFNLVDAIQLATAVKNNAEVFITNDKKLQRFNELQVLLLTSL